MEEQRVDEYNNPDSLYMFFTVTLFHKTQWERSGRRNVCED